MKVLLIHQHFKIPQQGGAIRSYYLAQALIEKGIEVIVITAHDKNYKKEIVEGIEVHWLRVPYSNDFGFWRRGFSFLNFVRKSEKHAKYFKNVSLCYAISVPLTVGLIARRIKRKCKVPYVFEVGDLWPDAPVQLGFVKNYFLKHYLFSLERKIYRSASAVVALSPSIQSAIQMKIPGKRVEIIPNMADTDFFEKGSKDSVLLGKMQLQDKFVVSYIGALGVANGLDYIIACAEASRKAGLLIHFILCGEGAMKERLLREVKQKELDNISILEFTNREGVKSIMRISDASFVSYQPATILETGSPNKLFDGLASGKLIIINFGGWLRKELEENNCGIYVDPIQASDFVKKIKSFINDRLLLENYQFNARSLAERKYSRKELAQRFSALIAEFN